MDSLSTGKPVGRQKFSLLFCFMSAHLVESHLLADGQPVGSAGQPAHPEQQNPDPDPVQEYLAQPGHDGSAAVSGLEPMGAS
ncbi:MAG: hypothetical protein RLZZ347_138 [Candidatus Parcubacteria bacterium]